MAKRVLIVYATKHGATEEIAERIAGVLREAGLPVDLFSAVRAADPAGYDAVVLGASVYMGRWRKEGAAFLKENAAALAGRPVWVFSSGPTGEGDPKELVKGRLFPEKLRPLLDGIGPREITVFLGAIDVKKLGRFERWIVRNVKAPVGDFRDWAAVDRWAGRIAEALLRNRS
ncbi:MAG: flavodoxin domain-containing protein [Candidatus Eisenbacteria bacterium]|nr:flavodoxin domain-containing protein [Candidatus Eisenbacteria bacterium]